MQPNFKQKLLLFELLIIIIAAFIGLLFAHYFNLYEIIYAYSRTYEEYQVDEIITVFIVLAFGLGIFSFRRWREQVREHAELRRLMAEKEKMIGELQDAMEKIRILKGYLPICSHCKKIRDDEGHWQQLEKYISEHSEAKFSHGICPICLRKYYDSDFSEKDSFQQ